MSCEIEKVDRLSSMPEDVISHILSLMLTKYAVRTSTLSKRWRYLWMPVTNLDLDLIHHVHDLDSFVEFVDRVLKLCSTSHLKLFRLCHYGEIFPSSWVFRWTSEAVRLNVCELEIQVGEVELPVCLFTCKTLTTLKLHSVEDRIIQNLSSPVDLPCLKTLDIGNYGESSVNLFKLINGCPILESLTLFIASNANKEEYNFFIPTLNFSIPTLKRLKLTMQECVKLVLNAPNLECLYIRGTWCPPCVIEYLPSLVEATIFFVNVRSNHLPIELLRGISGAKSISWSCPTLDAFSDLKSLEFPKFSSLKCLEMKRCGWLAACLFLENTCGLEHLCIQKMSNYTYWVVPRLVPTCMLTNLRTVDFAKYKLWENELRFLEYMLGNAKVLKTLTVRSEVSCDNKELQLHAQMLKFPRASRHCEVHFH